MATRSPVSAIDPNGRGGDERAASPLRLSESSVARLMLAADGALKDPTAGTRQREVKTVGAGHGRFLTPPDDGDEKMSARWGCGSSVKRGDESLDVFIYARAIGWSVSTDCL